MRRLVVVGVTILALVFTGGCGATGEGGDSEEGLSPTSGPNDTPTVAAEDAVETPEITDITIPDRAELEEILRSMALKLGDLPAGFTLESEEFTTNAEEAEDDPDGSEAALKRYERNGRVLGYAVDYSREVSFASLVTGGTFQISGSVAYYATVDGTKEAFSYADEQDLSERLGEVFPSDEFRNVEAARMSFPRVGDETLAWQVTGEAFATESGLELEFVAQFVGLRQQNALGTVATVAIQGPSAIEELERMVRALSQRIEENLS